MDAAALFQRARRRPRGRAVRPRHHAGHRRSGVKAAIIKCATDTAGVTPVIENILRASARAQKATGVPISTHTWAAGRTGRGAAGDLRAGGRRSLPRHHRAQRRQRRPRIPARAHGAGEHHRDGPFGLETSCPPRSGSRCSPGSAPRAMPGGWSSRTTPTAGATCSPGEQAPDAAAMALQPHLRRHPARAAQGRRSEEQVDQMLVHNPRAIFEARQGDRGAAGGQLERRSGPICRRTAPRLHTPTERLRLACSLRAPPRSWTLLLALAGVSLRQASQR